MGRPGDTERVSHDETVSQGRFALKHTLTTPNRMSGRARRLLRLPLLTLLTGLLILDAGYVLMHSAAPAHSETVGQPDFIQEVAQSNAAISPASSAPVAPPMVPTAIAAARLSDAEIAQLAVEPTPATCGSLTGRLVTETVRSAALGVNLPVHVYLPPCYNDRKHIYPAIYLFRGTDGYGNWVKNGLPEVADLQIGLGLLPPFIAVMPATDESSANGGKFRYSSRGNGSWEDFIVNELLPAIERRYSVWQTPAGRAIGGISRGAYWSIEIAFQHPDLFGIVGGHSPAITSDLLIGTPAGFSMLSMARSIGEIKKLRIHLDAGDRDWAQRGVRQLSADLSRAGIAYTTSAGQGIHNDAYWKSRMTDYLAFYAATWPRIPRLKTVTAGSVVTGRLSQP